jgi:hypothetical protein
MRQSSAPDREAMRRGLKYRWKGVMSWEVCVSGCVGEEGLRIDADRECCVCGVLLRVSARVPPSPYLQRARGRRQEAEGDVRPGDGRELCVRGRER